jgi:multiple sugar transport system ATP-binding protein
MSEVKLINVKKTYKDGFEAIKDVSCIIKDKEFAVLVGPSGCGKSTVLRMIAGLEEISDGEIYIGDKKVNDVPPSDRGISMVFQNYALYPHMTAFRNMEFGLKVNKIEKQERKIRVLEAAKILDLEELLQKKPGEMSGGQRQRVAIGRAMVRNPNVFLFDEPLSNLDAKLRSNMRIEIAKLHEKVKTTMIYVTHDQVEAMTLGDRIIVLDKGNIMQIDPPMELYNNPDNLFVAGFIGSPSMNFIDGFIRKEENKLVFKGGTFSYDTSQMKYSDLTNFIDKQVVFGIRSENIHDSNNHLNFRGTLNVKINSIELIGSDKLVYALSEGTDLVAKFKSGAQVSRNETINFYFDLTQSFLFEKQSGERIR